VVRWACGVGLAAFDRQRGELAISLKIGSGSKGVVPEGAQVIVFVALIFEVSARLWLIPLNHFTPPNNSSPKR
jgi:hypothetical protein